MKHQLQRLSGRVAANGNDEGVAMIMVMGTIVVMTLLLTASFGYVQAVEPQARDNQDWNAALSAAQAGVDDYVAKLNANDAYWQTTPCANKAVQKPMTTTNTCGWTSSTAMGWQNVSASNPKAGKFHYDIDTSVIYSQGAIRLDSTGKVGTTSRSIEVMVSRGGSTQFLYYTDFEDADPGNTIVYPSGPASDNCGKSGASKAKYWWQVSGGRSGCTEIQFVAGDSLDGAVHFNDTPYINGATTFTQGYETADPKCQTYSVANCRRGSGTPNFPNGVKASYADVLTLPDNADQFATFPGCQYTGDTRIRFNNDGTMTVWSYGSTTGSLGTGCGTAGSSWPQTVNVPNDQVIYVKNPTSGSGAGVCATGAIGDGLPEAGDLNVNYKEFYCRQGNVYIEGTVKGRVTVAAQNNVVVTGDVLVDGVSAGAAPSGSNLVGLVAANSVVVAHPVNSVTTCDSRGRNCTTSKENMDTAATRHIYASIQTLQHSFWVQSYADGDHVGTLEVYGSIAQKWRGIVGQSGSSGPGYLKDYNYDPRLKYVSPPYFPQWTNAQWQGRTTSEIKAQY